MTARFNRVKSLDFLEERYLGKPGYVNIVCTGNWVGQCFRTDEDGLADAVNFAAKLDQGNPMGVYYRVSTLRDIPGPGKRGERDDTLFWPGPYGDVDYGTAGHKKSALLPPDADAAMKVIEDSGCPAPTTLISSGGGLYPEWEVGTGVTIQSDEVLDATEEFSKLVQRKLLLGSLVNGWTYGEGVYDLARVLRLPGSVNRKTDTPRMCEVIGGTGKPVAIGDFTAPDAARVLHLQRQLAQQHPDAAPAAPLPQKRVASGPSTGRGVLDVIGELGWDEILPLADWTHEATTSIGEEWLRPGGDASSKYSARILHAEPNVLVVHSESAGMPVGGGQRLTKARVYSYLAGYRGDMSATARALIAGENPLGLPASVFDDVAAVMAERDSTFFGIAVPTIVRPAPADPEGPQPSRTPDPMPGGAATDDEMRYFLRTYIKYNRPARLTKRVGWAKADPPSAQLRHFVALVNDALAGHYPAEHALRAMADVHRHHQGAVAPRLLLSLALGAALNAKVAA